MFTLFFLVCALLYLLPRWYADPSQSNTLFLGIVAGLIPLVRNPNAPILLFLPLYGITNWNTLIDRIHFSWQYKKKLLFLFFVFALIFSPQVIIWKIATDSFFLKSYIFSFENLNFLSPQIFKVLFHLHHGLFIWSPILVFSILGLFKMKGPLKSYGLPIVVCLLAHVYVVSCWYLWYYGWSFGHRAFVDILGMFAIPLACFFGSLKKSIIKRIVFSISSFFIALTFFLFLQYFQGILPGEMRPLMTWQEYKSVLLNTDGLVDLWQWLKNPSVNNLSLLR